MREQTGYIFQIGSMACRLDKWSGRFTGEVHVRAILHQKRDIAVVARIRSDHQRCKPIRGFVMDIASRVQKRSQYPLTTVIRGIHQYGGSVPTMPLRMPDSFQQITQREGERLHQRVRIGMFRQQGMHSGFVLKKDRLRQTHISLLPTVGCCTEKRDGQEENQDKNQRKRAYTWRQSPLETSRYTAEPLL